MDKVSIEGIVLTDLKMINHPQGNIYHAMKKGDKRVEKTPENDNEHYCSRWGSYFCSI
jgi:hypothetical protein